MFLFFFIVILYFSFGQTAIFLIGGRTKEEKPTGVFLRSGDIVVMSKESRLCYHAVPRIMKTNKELWNDDDPEIRSMVYNYLFYLILN